MRIIIENISQSTLELVAKSTGWKETDTHEVDGELVPLPASIPVGNFIAHCLKGHAKGQITSEARLAAKSSASASISSVEGEAISVSVEEETE